MACHCHLLVWAGGTMPQLVKRGIAGHEVELSAIGFGLGAHITLGKIHMGGFDAIALATGVGIGDELWLNVDAEDVSALLACGHEKGNHPCACAGINDTQLVLEGDKVRQEHGINRKTQAMLTLVQPPAMNAKVGPF